MKKPQIPPAMLNLNELNNSRELLVQFSNAMKGQDYPHWEQIRYKLDDKSLGPQVWTLAKIFRNTNGNTERKFGEIDVKWNNLPALQETIYKFDREYLSITKRINVLENLAIQVDNLRHEAISSSILEGAVTTRKAAIEMIERDKRPKTIGEKMVMNNYQTMNFINEIISFEMSEEILLKIHELITSNTLDNSENEGKFRKSNDINVVDWTTSEIFWTPPDYMEAKKMMLDLINFMNKDKPFIHPIIKASIIHFMIGFIHPFMDGNGRTARALFYWYLLKKEYELMQYLSISTTILDTKTQYYKAYLYSETDENDLTYFILYQIKVLNRAFEKLLEKINLLEKVSEKIFKTRIGYEDLNERQKYLMLMSDIDPKKIWTVKSLMSQFNIVQETARKDLLEREERNLIKGIMEGKRKIYYFPNTPK